MLTASYMCQPYTYLYNLMLTASYMCQPYTFLYKASECLREKEMVEFWDCLNHK